MPKCWTTCSKTEAQPKQMASTSVLMQFGLHIPECFYTFWNMYSRNNISHPICWLSTRWFTLFRLHNPKIVRTFWIM